MTGSAGLAQVAALVGDPGRANMLDALLDRRALADALVARGAVVLGEEAGEVTAHGRDLLAEFGIAEPQGGRRIVCRPCLDWSERRPHLAGTVGAALCRRCEDLGWIARHPDSRVFSVTEAGRRGLQKRFGVAVPMIG